MDQFDSEDENKRPGVPVDAGRLMQAVRRHWLVIPTAVAIGALLGLGVAVALIKPSYTAKATVLWEPPADTTAEPSDRSFLTQVDSIKLASNLKEVKKRLRSKLTIDELKEKINLLFDGQSHLVQVEATDGTAKGATALANTVVEVFLDYQRSIGRERGSEHLKRLDADIAGTQAQFKVAQEALDAFRAELGVADFDTELKQALVQVSTLRQGIEAAEVEIATEGTNERQMTQEAQRVPSTKVSGETLSSPDRAALAAAESQLAAERAHLSADHPTVLRLQRQVDTLRERVKNSSMVSSGVSMTANPEHVAMASGAALSKVKREAAIQKRESLKAQLAAAETRLAQLTAAQPRATQLLAAVTSQETHKNELEALRVRTRDQVRSAAAGFRIVTPASLPDRANPSSRKAVVIRAPLAMLFLSLLGIVLYELRGLRVHTAREAGYWANAAVVASSTWPREQTTLGALIDELSDAAPAVRGTTLVVGARVNEVPLAREIAYWLSHLTSNVSQRGVVGADEPVVADAASGGSVRVSPESSPPGGGTALARRGNDALAVAQAWDGPPHGPSLRRASRLADRVLVVVAAGTMSMTEISTLRSRLGRSTGIGVLLVGLNPEYVKLPDRVGEVERFWEDRAA